MDGSEQSMLTLAVRGYSFKMLEDFICLVIVGCLGTKIVMMIHN